MLKDDFPRIWVPGWENRDLRQLLWHRHRIVQARTRIMNQLQAVALNEGLRCKKRLWGTERQRLESFRLAPWASRRWHELLELLDRLDPRTNKTKRSLLGWGSEVSASADDECGIKRRPWTRHQIRWASRYSVSLEFRQPV